MTAATRHRFTAILKHIPTVLILGLLAGVALLGHWTDWKIAGLAKLWGGEKEEKQTEEEGRTHVEVDPCLAAACGLGYVRARPTDRLRIVFPTPEDVDKTGLEFAEVSTRPVEQSIAAVGELDFERTHYAVLAPRVTGTVWHVYAQPGDVVTSGQLLSLVESNEVGRAKSEFLTSLVHVERSADALRGLEEAKPNIPERQIREGRAMLREARIKLFNDHQALINFGLDIALRDVMGKTEDEAFNKVSGLGVPDSLRQGTHEDGMTANLLPLKAPFGGVIVSMRKGKGEAVGPTEPQYVLADLNTLWLMLNVRPDEAGQLRPKQVVFFRAKGMDGEVQGELTWISAEVDEKARVVIARAEVANPGGKLRPRTFGGARIVIESNAHALTVPNAAVQTEDGVSYVFVRLDDTTFQTRRVEIGGRQNGFTEIVQGVVAGETVVTKGSHALKSELFKERIGGEE